MNIAVSTGTVSVPYEVLDTVFAIDSSKAKWFSGADPNEAFEGVKKTLRKKASEMGGDAVIDCQFEYRNALEEGMFGSKGVLEIFAYGTVVKFV